MGREKGEEKTETKEGGGGTAKMIHLKKSFNLELGLKKPSFQVK